jgi:hypothetical protein
VELAGLEAENTETASYSYASAIGGKAASQEVRRTETEVTIRDSAEVVTYAGGTEDNAQAKARAGYDLLLKGTSQCGPWGEYEVALVQR